jgi:hypothetical protein
MAKQPGLNIEIDVKELKAYAKKLSAVEKVTSTAAAGGLNEVGDGLVAVLARDLAGATGLSIEQVRGLLKVRRASRARLEYDITLLSEGDLRKMEGKRESGDFGKFDQGQLVIVVSKKDELVCMDCEELEAAGPMPAEVAMQHVPKHPNCRCVIMPYVSKKRLPVTMTPLQGARRQVGSSLDENMTLRQLAQNILDRTTRAVRIELR